MSRLFDDAQNEYLDISQAVVSGTPFAVVFLFNTNDDSDYQVPFFLGNITIADQYFEIILNKDDHKIWAFTRQVSSVQAVTSTNWSLDTWHHACGIFASSTDRRALIDGGSKGTNAEDRTPVGLAETTIGRRARLNPAQYMSGHIAEVAIWDLSAWPGATDSDKADNFEKILPSLAKGFSPQFFPLGLKAYWPLIRGIKDKVGEYNLTASGTVVAPHPRIIVPIGPQFSWTSHIDVTVTPTALALALTQHAPSLAFDCTVTPATFELALTQHAPSLAFDYTIFPSTLELALTQHAPAPVIDCTVLAETFELVLTLHQPIVTPFAIVTPSTFELAATLLAPGVSIDCTVAPTALALALTLHAPTIIIPADVTVLPDTFELALTQPSPLVSIRFIDIPPFMHEDLIDPYGGMGAWLWLAEIVVPTQATQRIACNTADVVYGGILFVASNFDPGRISLAGDASIPRIQLRVAQDPDHTLEDIVNATKGGKNGTIKLIRTCEKYFDRPVNALERTYDILTAGSDPMWVTFTLGIPNPLTQRIPLWSYSSKVCPLATPSLFKGPRCQYPGEDTVCTGLFSDCRTKGNEVHWGAEIGLDPNAVRV